MNKNQKNIIPHTTLIRDAVKKLDTEKLNSLIVIDNKKKVVGIFTMGDFRRAVFNGLDINSEILLIINKKFEYLTVGYSNKEARDIFVNNETIIDIPVLNKNFKLEKIITKKKINSSKFYVNQSLEKIPVVIMAGGKGTRLDPFTRILPKPLIPFGNEPILKIILDYFIKFGSNKFYISINEKGDMIKAYFHDQKSRYNLKYVEEKKPLGTAGSIKLLKHKLKETFFAVNSDIIIYSNYLSILQFHKSNNYDLTIVSSMRSHTIPYGVCKLDNSGKLIDINEKPEYNFLVNTGFYVMEPKVLNLIPDNKQFDMIQLIKKVRKKGMNVGVFPVSENSWIDVGQWSEYKKNINKFIT